MTIEIKLKKKLSYFDIDISCVCPDRKMLVMIGPSGGGKTSIIRMLAGLDRPDEGRIVFNEEVWFDSSDGVNLPVQRRRLGYVFQDYTLFPHLTLYQNAAFAAVNKKEIDELFEILKISHLRDRKPSMVSGGERQRCAICQALARHPRILLLDEPFSALDVVTRRELREELRTLKKHLSFPVIYVTHDITEALYLADDILPIVQGVVDESWMESMKRGTKPGEDLPRAAREQKLALVY